MEQSLGGLGREELQRTDARRPTVGRRTRDDPVHWFGAAGCCRAQVRQPGRGDGSPDAARSCRPNYVRPPDSRTRRPDRGRLPRRRRDRRGCSRQGAGWRRDRACRARTTHYRARLAPDPTWCDPSTHRAGRRPASAIRSRRVRPESWTLAGHPAARTQLLRSIHWLSAPSRASAMLTPAALAAFSNRWASSVGTDVLILTRVGSSCAGGWAGAAGV